MKGRILMAVGLVLVVFFSGVSFSQGDEFIGLSHNDNFRVMTRNQKRVSSEIVIGVLNLFREVKEKQKDNLSYRSVYLFIETNGDPQREDLAIEIKIDVWGKSGQTTHHKLSRYFPKCPTPGALIIKVFVADLVDQIFKILLEEK